MEFMFTNRVLSANEALDWLIVTRVVSDKDLIPEAELLVRQLAAGPTKAFGAVKRLLQSGLAESFEAQMKHESHSISEMGRTADGREGIAAFSKKRKANFKGE